MPWIPRQVLIGVVSADTLGAFKYNKMGFMEQLHMAEIY
jgi:hypothetical protein